jgi:uncharacterized protein
MDDWQMWLSGAIWLLPLAAVILWLWYRKGFLSPGAFRDAPDRDVPVTAVDLLPGLGLMILGALALRVFAARVYVGEPQIVPGDSGADATNAFSATVAILVSQLLLMGLPAVWFAVRAAMGEAGFRRSGLLPRRPMRDLRWAGIALLGVVPVVMATTLIVTGISLLAGQSTPMIGHQMLEQMRSQESVLPLVMLLVSAVVVAPLLEELVFRGLLQTALLNTLGPQRRWLILLLASILFASTHLGAAIWQSLAALTVLSMVLGFLYERTGSLWPSILVHAGFNAWNVALVLWLIEPGAA